MAMNISKTKKVFFWIVTAILLYVVVELASLAFLQIFNIRSSSRGYPDKLFVYDEKLDFKQQPNFSGYFSGPGYSSIEIKINSLGFRDHEFTLNKNPEVYRVLVVGNSITFGAGVRSEDTYVKQTEGLLNSSTSKTYQVINAGVGAYHFEHYYLFIKEYIEEIDPDYLVIGFCINDLRPREVVAPRYRVRKINISNFTSTVKHVIKRTIKKSPLFQVFSYFRFSNTYNRTKFNTLWISQVMMSWENDELVEKFTSMLDEIKRLTEEMDIEFSIVVFPEMNQLINYEKYGAPRGKLLRILQNLQISYLDLYDTFVQTEDFSEYYLKGDTVHFTTSGHRIIAEELKRFLDKALSEEQVLSVGTTGDYGPLLLKLVQVFMGLTANKE